ncbi:hypothetical protein CSKR_203049 [Clonorchis sinensis]|uniref:Uncharacterized protein n=1 Tax=Clonorchis sinensis TaxID=79923 RepID=A0A8T1M6M0_CLOSI|nr:hypothetical protein CSKR_203049 [Clonorchis sinensis]
MRMYAKIVWRRLSHFGKCSSGRKEDDTRPENSTGSIGSEVNEFLVSNSSVFNPSMVFLGRSLPDSLPLQSSNSNLLTRLFLALHRFQEFGNVFLSSRILRTSKN